MSSLHKIISEEKKIKFLKKNSEVAVQELLKNITFQNFKKALLSCSPSSIEDENTTIIALIVHLISKNNSNKVSWYIISDDNEHYETFHSIFTDINWSRGAFDFQDDWGIADAEIDELDTKLSSDNFEKKWREYLKC